MPITTSHPVSCKLFEKLAAFLKRLLKFITIVLIPLNLGFLDGNLGVEVKMGMGSFSRVEFRSSKELEQFRFEYD